MTSRLRSLFNRHFPLDQQAATGTAAARHPSRSQYFVAFLVMHEVTAVLPIPMIYYALSASAWQPQINDARLLEEGTRFAERFAKRYFKKDDTKDADKDGGEKMLAQSNDPQARTEDDDAIVRDVTTVSISSTQLIHLATAYTITKILMPVRIAASVAMTPWLARTMVRPILLLFKKR